MTKGEEEEIREKVRLSKMRGWECLFEAMKSFRYAQETEDGIAAAKRQDARRKRSRKERA